MTESRESSATFVSLLSRVKSCVRRHSSFRWARYSLNISVLTIIEIVFGALPSSFAISLFDAAGARIRMSAIAEYQRFHLPS